MRILSRYDVSGEDIRMRRTSSRHFNDNGKIGKKSEPVKTFADLLNNAFGRVNEYQFKADEMTQRLVVGDSSVDVHNVMIAAEKARLSLAFTKSVVDKLVDSFKQLTMLR